MWHVVGCYTVLDNASFIEAIVASIIQRYRVTKLLVSGDFNSDFEASKGITHDK